MAAPDILWAKGRFGQTARRDNWWLDPFLVFLGFGAFLVYANWAAFQGNHYTSGPYISPFYSPKSGAIRRTPGSMAALLVSPRSCRSRPRF